MKFGEPSLDLVMPFRETILLGGLTYLALRTAPETDALVASEAVG